MRNRKPTEFAAMRLKRLAQGFNPGLIVHKERPESGVRKSLLSACEILADMSPHIGCHFQGTSFSTAHPGLKPAVMYSRFRLRPSPPLATSDESRQKSDTSLPDERAGSPIGTYSLYSARTLASLSSPNSVKAIRVFGFRSRSAASAEYAFN
jgi:hypothetical protein